MAALNQERFTPATDDTIELEDCEMVQKILENGTCKKACQYEISA